jgi:drug/metabolite transporter (DMT)-like permease
LPLRHSLLTLSGPMPTITMTGKRLRADLALGFISLIWGATFVIVKGALADASIFAFIAVRFTLAAILMGILFWRSLRGLDLQGARAGIQIGIFLFGGFAFQTAGLKYTTASKSAFITGSCVILVPILLGVFGRHRITAGIWAGALAAFAGLYLLTVPAGGLSALNRGDLLTLVCAFMFALHFISLGRHAGRFPVGALSFLQVATSALLAIIFLPVAAALGWETPRLNFTENLVFSILATAIGATVICFWLQTWAQQYASPSHTAILVSFEPIFAALTSWFVAHEHFTARMLAGAALIFTGILLAELKGPATASPESTEPILRHSE